MNPTVTLDWSWNALYRTSRVQSSALEHIPSNSTETRRCCLGIAVAAVCPSADLFGISMPVGLQGEANKCWRRHTSASSLIENHPAHRTAVDSVQVQIESEIAELNDGPYHYADSPQQALHQLTYMFSLIGLDLVIPNDIRQAYIDHWTPIFADHQENSQ